MKRLAMLGALVSTLIGSVSCGQGEADDIITDNPYKKLELSTKSAELARRSNEFAFNYIKRIDATTDGNYVVSPMSMQFLLGLLLNGAQGETADEITSVLGYGEGEKEAVNEFCLSVLQQLPGLDKQTRLSIANAIVVNQKYHLLGSYEQSVAHYYNAEVSRLDFTSGPSAARTINKWCSDRTQGLIPKIVESVSPEDVAYLINAMYFKSRWWEKFPASKTGREGFTRADGSKTSVKMMKRTGDMLYNENNDYRAVRLHFGNGAYSMYFILPVPGKSLGDVCAALTPDGWAEFSRNMHLHPTEVWIPRFETKFHIRANDILQSLGMSSAFAGSADFSAMLDAGVSVSYVQQDAAISVDEEGAEVAVVSYAGMYTAPAPQETVVFHADQPFLYLIVEGSTGAIIFAGRYAG